MNETERQIEALLKEINDVKVVRSTNSGEYWTKYLRILEDEMIELSLLGEVVTSRAERIKNEG